MSPKSPASSGLQRVAPQPCRQTSAGLAVSRQQARETTPIVCPSDAAARHSSSEIITDSTNWARAYSPHTHTPHPTPRPSPHLCAVIASSSVATWQTPLRMMNKPSGGSPLLHTSNKSPCRRQMEALSPPPSHPTPPGPWVVHLSFVPAPKPCTPHPTPLSSNPPEQISPAPLSPNPPDQLFPALVLALLHPLQVFDLLTHHSERRLRLVHRHICRRGAARQLQWQLATLQCRTVTGNDAQPQGQRLPAAQAWHQQG